MGDVHPALGDGVEFHLLARLLADGHGYIQPGAFLFEHGRVVHTAEKPVLFPVYLAAWTKLGLTGYTAQRAVTAALGAVTVALAGLLGRRVAGERAGLVAAGLAALYPMLVALDGSMRSEALYVPLVCGALLITYRLLERPRLAEAVALGALVGLAALTRSEALLLVPALGLPLALRLGRPAGLRVLAAITLATLVVVAPWAIRNWATFDRPTALSTNEGGLLAGANCPRAYYGSAIGSWPCFRVEPEGSPNEAATSARLRREALDYAGDHLGRLPAVVAVRVLRTWELWDPRSQAELETGISERRLGVQQAGVVSLYLLAALAAYGIVLLRRRRAVLFPLVVPLLLVTLVSALTYGTTRFRAAAEVPVVVLASVALQQLVWERRRA
jgi:4-amino-4-deoxy-L-arabinose transferase-like glycosyltransferase